MRDYYENCEPPPHASLADSLKRKLQNPDFRAAYEAEERSA